ncbi:pyrimidine/purine nucleoside phosphorylase [Chitinophaga sp.]|uniref:pyrimidine/purine nucleoside phosphorylase n=1 Tax=Chitinophaga sp. TaxID=1869181 RepID=UPI0031E2ACB5
MSSVDKISHNVYFDGKVQSLGVQVPKGKATVGVMKQGTYSFNTGSPEIMEVIIGEMSAKLPGGELIRYRKGESFEVPGNSSFEVVCEADVAYICYYE